VRVGRFLEVNTELITILETHPETFTTIINQTIEQHLEELDALIALLGTVEYTSPEREFGTIYHNDSGKIILVHVIIDLAVLKPADGTILLGDSQVSAGIGHTEEIEYEVANGNLWTDLSNLKPDAQQLIGHRTSLTFMVPAGWYYMIESAYHDHGQEPVIMGWKEWFLH